MKMTNVKFYVILLSMFYLVAVKGQYYTTHHNMIKLPRVQINPALPLPNETEIDLFGLGLDLNLPFSYKSVIQGSGKNKVLDVNKLINAPLSKTNTFANNATIVLPSLYLRFNKLSLYFYNRLQAQSLFSFDRGALELLAEGNTNSTFFGKTAKLNLGFRTTLYIVTGLGGSYQINEKLRVGTTFKIYNGVADMRTTQNTNVSLTTGQERNFPLTLSAEGGIESSNILKPNTATGDIKLKDLKFRDFDVNDLINSIGRGRGYGIDLGATYKLTEELTLEFALTDLNLMTWTKNIQGYKFVKEETSFNGVDITNAIRGQNLDLKVNFDTLTDNLKASDSKISDYKGSATPAVLSVGANYILPNKVTVGGLLRGRKFFKTIDYSLSLYAHKTFSSIGIGLNYTAEKNNFLNLGLGLTTGPFYIMTDNILGALALLSTKQASARFGFRMPLKGGKSKSINKEKDKDKKDDKNRRGVDDYGRPKSKPIDLNVDNYKPRERKQDDLNMDTIKKKKKKKKKK